MTGPLGVSSCTTNLARTITVCLVEHDASDRFVGTLSVPKTNHLQLLVERVVVPSYDVSVSTTIPHASVHAVSLLVEPGALCAAGCTTYHPAPVLHLSQVNHRGGPQFNASFPMPWGSSTLEVDDDAAGLSAAATATVSTPHGSMVLPTLFLCHGVFVGPGDEAACGTVEDSVPGGPLGVDEDVAFRHCLTSADQLAGLCVGLAATYHQGGTSSPSTIALDPGSVAISRWGTRAGTVNTLVTVHGASVAFHPVVVRRPLGAPQTLTSGSLSIRPEALTSVPLVVSGSEFEPTSCISATSTTAGRSSAGVLGELCLGLTPLQWYGVAFSQVADAVKDAVDAFSKGLDGPSGALDDEASTLSSWLDDAVLEVAAR